MELCDFNLEEYIRGKNSLLYDLSHNSRLLGLPFKERGVWNVWDIMEQISIGVQFIHDTEQVHRDLKPRNGTPISKNILIFSAIFRDRQSMESG